MIRRPCYKLQAISYQLSSATSYQLSTTQGPQITQITQIKIGIGIGNEALETLIHHRDTEGTEKGHGIFQRPVRGRPLKTRLAACGGGALSLQLGFERLVRLWRWGPA